VAVGCRARLAVVMDAHHPTNGPNDLILLEKWP